MQDILMVRYGEIYLKGLNRPYFLRLLLERVRKAVSSFGARAELSDSRIYVRDAEDVDACLSALQKVPGVHSIAVARSVPKDDFDGICRLAADIMSDYQGSFKVVSRRSDKRYSLDSPQISARIGEKVLRSNPQLSVDVKNPQHELGVEIRDRAYLYAKVLPGAGGMPTGSNGRAALLLSGGIDSPVAGYMIAKRGVELMAVHFFSFPYTGERAKEKVAELARILAVYCGGMKIFMVPFTEIQMLIHERCPEDHTTLIMRRMMMRIADRIALREGAQALITGESIGQVASQTMEALACTDAVANRPVFRPLIGFDKIEITRCAEQIGTYDTSILPYEDCCTVFTPRHPVTRPKLERVAKAEARLGAYEELLDTAIANAEIHEV